MRVATISTFPPQRCGIGYYTKDMVETMSDKHPKLEFFILAESRPWIFYKVKNQGRINEYRIWDRHSSFYPLKIFQFILKIKPDVVLVQHEYGLYGSYGGIFLSLLLVLLRLFRFPIVMTMHTVCPRRLFINRLRYSFRFSIKTIVWRSIDVILTTLSTKKLVNKVIVHSDGLASQMMEEYGFPKEKLMMIPHGASFFPNVNQDDAKNLLNLKGKKVILSFGFLSYRKGYEGVIEAVYYLSQKHKNLIYLIAGTPQTRLGVKYLEDLKSRVKKLKLEKKVKFYIKQIPKEEVPTIFGAADIVILPYLELFGDSGVLRQAASFAKPVITTTVGAMTEEIENGINGVIVPPADNITLKKEIDFLLTHPKTAKQMGIKLRNKAVREWAWEDVVDRVYNIFMEVHNAPKHIGGSD